MTIYDFTVINNKGEDVSLSEYKGKVLLIVNVASKCGYTKQYSGLQALYEKYKDKGFVILGFPCNQFAYQEPGSDAEILSFCQVNFGVTFPLFKKIKVNGKDADPLYVYLKEQAKSDSGKAAIRWNFTKFLIDKDGNVHSRYDSKVKPEELDSIVAELL